MKKQILLLTFLSMAILFASVNSYGQYQTVPSGAPTCLTPRPLDASCSTTDELHPQPGVMYNYIVTTSSADDDIQWFVVNNADVEAAGSTLIDSLADMTTTQGLIDPADGTGTYILSLGTNNAYNDAPVNNDGSGISSTGGVDHQIDISWKFFDGNQPNEVLLVGIVTDDAGCTDNIFAYRIIPNPTFTLDVAALGIAGDSIAGPGETGIGPCVSPIESAEYTSVDDVVGNGTLTVNFGENWVYFIVNANNFVDSWMPEFEISYTGTNDDALSASWTYLAAATNASATWNTLTDGGTTWTSAVPVIAGGSDANGTPVNAAGTGVASASGGECIVVRVRVDHGTAEESTDPAGDQVRLAVDGVMYDNDNNSGSGTYYDDTSGDYDDLHYANCNPDGFTNDWTQQTITPRPEVDENSPTPFEDKTPDE